ncbi:hypothetical protein AUR04nite_32210 [Glutamicibacter uratoxydans]|uniref:HTH luxR-type domain-containing protein n=1 Tax=Glutamicibacter uratoxydans TaxID=43667 RepID=A0A4Y4DQR0_GLUUR|nr:hypothetical protein AUR04nite_32210 [Glutamicibacter uratoxydans]
MGLAVNLVDILQNHIANKHYELLIDFAIENFTELFNNYRVQFASRIGELPADVQSSHPELAILAAAAHSMLEPYRPIDLVQTQHSLQRISDAAKTSEDPFTQFRVAGLRLGALRILMLVDQAAEAARLWEEVVDSLPPNVILSKKKMFFVFAVQCVAAYTHGGYFNDAIRAAQRLNQDDNQLRHLHVRSLVSLSYALNGDVNSARKLTNSFDDGRLPEAWDSAYNAIGYHLARALISVEDARPHDALARLDELDRFFHVVDHWAFILIVRARALIYLGTPAVAADEIHKLMLQSAGRRAGKSTFDLLYAAYLDLLQTAGLYQRVTRMKEYVQERLAAFQLAEARAVMNTDESQALTLTREILDSDASLRHHAESLLVQAIAFQRLDLPDLAEDAAEKLAASVERNGIPSVLTYAPRPEVLFLLQRRAPQLVELVKDFPYGPDDSIRSKVILTETQLRILAQLVSHASVPKLAESMFISPNTAKTHLRNIYLKLGVNNRADAVQAALRLGLI